MPAADHLPRRKRIRLAAAAYRQGDPFLVTLCAHGRASPFLDARLATLVLRHLDAALESGARPVGAYCLMPDHLHVVLSGSRDVVCWVAKFKSATTSAARRAGFVGQLWQRGFHDRCLSRLDDSIDSAVQYVLGNPVRKGLVARAESWPYSRNAWA